MLSVFRFQSLVKHNRKQSLVKHQGKSVPLSDNLVFLSHKVATFFIFFVFLPHKVATNNTYLYKLSLNPKP